MPQVDNRHRTNRRYMADVFVEGDQLKQGVVGIWGNITDVLPDVSLLEGAPYPFTVSPAGNKTSASSTSPSNSSH